MALYNVETPYEPLAKTALEELRAYRKKAYRKIKRIQYSSTEKWDISTDSDGNPIKLSRIIATMDLKTNVDIPAMGVIMNYSGSHTRNALLFKRPIMKAWSATAQYDSMYAMIEAYEENRAFRFRSILPPNDNEFDTEDLSAYVTREYPPTIQAVSASDYSRKYIDRIRFVAIVDDTFGNEASAFEQGVLDIYGLDYID